MIGEVLTPVEDGGADFAIADLSMTSSRSEVVDFSMPWMTLGIICNKGYMLIGEFVKKNIINYANQFDVTSILAYFCNVNTFTFFRNINGFRHSKKGPAQSDGFFGSLPIKPVGRSDPR